MTTSSQHRDELLRAYERQADLTQLQRDQTVVQQREPSEERHDYEPLADDQPDDALQRKRYGGVNWGAGFFGWLVVVAMTLLLAAAVGTAVLALARTGDVVDVQALSESRNGGLVAAGVLVGALLISYFAGGYVAGRMSRFDGGKQGVAVWVTSLLLSGGLVGAGLLFGGPELLDQADLPTFDLSIEATSVVVLGAAAAALVGSLLAAVLGGKVGCRYHRKVDDAAYI